MEHKVDLDRQNVYGEAFIPKLQMLKAMAGIGLELRRANWRASSSAVHFIGEIEGIKVEVNANVMVINPHSKFSGTYGFDYLQVSCPHQDERATHFKVKAYIPSSTHLKGKYRDKKAWDIYAKIVSAIESEK